LELPERTTLQNEAPKQGGRDISALQGALDFALQDTEGEVFASSGLMGEQLNLSGENSRRSSKVDMQRISSRSASIRTAKSPAPKSTKIDDEMQYPSSKADRIKGRYA
jgi:hypothetical protein